MIRVSLFALGVLAAALLAGCAAAPARLEGAVQVPAQFSGGGARPPSARWWLDFDDPSLTSLIETALAENFSLRAAWARLDQARAVARSSEAVLWPSLEARGESSRQRSGGATTEQDLVGVTAGYEVDLWGRLRATSDAAELDARASAADLQTAAITLSAEVASTWYQLVEQRAQRDLVAVQLALNEQLLTLIEARFRIGQSAASDVHRQRQLLAQTRGELIQIETQLAILGNQLAVLLGAAPGEASLPGDAVLHLPGPLPATGLPAELVQRRPDLQRALLQLRAADARAATAVAERYPRLSLSAAATTTTGLFGSWLSNLAAQLTAPLFDGGRRRAEAERASAAVEENLNRYGQALLDAVREVEDALGREAGQQAYLVSLAEQLHEAESVVERERLRYFQGDSTYLSVLDALRSRQQLERQLLTARRELITRRVALVRSLAGGWNLSPPGG